MGPPGKLSQGEAGSSAGNQGDPQDVGHQGTLGSVTGDRRVSE